jgi:hypothetical protein
MFKVSLLMSAEFLRETKTQQYWLVGLGHQYDRTTVFSGSRYNFACLIITRSNCFARRDYASWYARS